MKKLLVVALTCVTVWAFGQGNIARVATVKPKIGHMTAFETAWKTHLAKFHGSDWKVSVYELLTGQNAGAYNIVVGPLSYADLDKERPNGKAHDEDWDKTCAVHLDMDMGPFYYTMRDSLSYNSQIVSEKAIVSVTHVKPDRMNDYIREARRSSTVTQTAFKDQPVGVNTYVQMWSGSDPVVVTIRSLVDGFKELETGYSKMPNNAFQTAYKNTYSQEQWDKRMTMMNADINSREVFAMKYRKDLSSK